MAKEDPHETDRRNINGDEADEVMMTLLMNTETGLDIHKVHSEIGHTASAALALNSNVRKQVMKAHRYFGHRSGRRI